MNRDDQWRLVNAYRKLVEAGRAKDFTCHHCQGKAIVMADTDLEPVVKCFFCGSKTRPNGDWWNRVRAIVTEWNV